MDSRENVGVIFQHLIDLPSSNCVFCSTLEQATGKIQLYLIFHDQSRIYVRNGIKDTWEELKDKHQCQRIQTGFSSAIEERKIPCFSSLNDL